MGPSADKRQAWSPWARPEGFLSPVADGKWGAGSILEGPGAALKKPSGEIPRDGSGPSLRGKEQRRRIRRRKKKRGNGEEEGASSPPGPSWSSRTGPRRGGVPIHWQESMRSEGFLLPQNNCQLFPQFFPFSFNSLLQGVYTGVCHRARTRPNAPHRGEGRTFPLRIWAIENHPESAFLSPIFLPPLKAGA